MICVLALVVFGILGIFSIRYRVIAKEALDCVFRRVTLRKCESGLDKRLKAQITGKLMRKNKKLGKIIYKNFEIISWFFTILLILSIIGATNGVYNFVAYGNCNGKGSEEFCIFDPLGTGTRGHNVTEACSISGDVHDLPLLKPYIHSSPIYGALDSEVVIVEFGCYSCPYTREAEPVMKQIREEYKDRYVFVFKHFPIETHNQSYESAIAAECARKQGMFWEYHEALFAHGPRHSDQDILQIAQTLQLNIDDFTQCYNNQETKDLVDADIQEGRRVGIYGTPTVFVNDDYLVGPQSFRKYKSLIRKKG
ncbi:thioredoxin domain-containing protein [Candidatus Woesearchaeota archaeon]|nr:thioredoxin domain-containing protein [Candidatus Woesearchaeota archaeon]